MAARRGAYVILEQSPDELSRNTSSFTSYLMDVEELLQDGKQHLAFPPGIVFFQPNFLNLLENISGLQTVEFSRLGIDSKSETRRRKLC